MNIVYTINNIFHQHSTPQELNIFRHHILVIFFDTSFLHYFPTHSHPWKMSKKIILFCRNDKIMYYFSTFHDNLRQRKPGDAKNVVVLCQKILSKKTVVENYRQKMLAKNVVKIYCRKKLS